MLEQGIWTGFYSFSDPRVNKIRGFDQTNFTIRIVQIDGENFSGTVEDDITTGGMEGVGLINGKVKGNSIEFIKRMPVMTMLMDQKGTRRTFDKKHSPIYYSGQFSADNKTIGGTWKFKMRIFWFGVIPIPMIPAKGTWSMKQIE